MLGETIKITFVSETNSLPPITCTIISDSIFVNAQHHIMGQSHLVFVCLIGILVLQNCSNGGPTLILTIKPNTLKAPRKKCICKCRLLKLSAANFVCFCCFTSHVNSYGHCGTVSSFNHTFSWAGLSKRLTSNLCTYFRL